MKTDSSARWQSHWANSNDRHLGGTMSWGGKCDLVLEDYIMRRYNGSVAPPADLSFLLRRLRPSSEFGSYERVETSIDDYPTFIEGSGTKAYMEDQDRKYLREIMVSNPELFLKEMSPRSELSASDQAAKLGLDLSLPHHQNLQREFAADVRCIIELRKMREEMEKMRVTAAEALEEVARLREENERLKKSAPHASVVPIIEVSESDIGLNPKRHETGTLTSHIDLVVGFFDGGAAAGAGGGGGEASAATGDVHATRPGHY